MAHTDGMRNKPITDDRRRGLAKYRLWSMGPEHSRRHRTDAWGGRIPLPKPSKPRGVSYNTGKPY